MGDFVHLHLHTEYSLLDGATRISEIADKALELGQSAVAITDHGVMYGVVEFYDALKKKGIKPIIGCEVYVASESRFMKEGKQHISGHHLVLLCKNEVGYRNLCYMVSESFINGFYMKPRIDMELLREHSEGLIALSACVAGKIPQYIISGNMGEAERSALEFREIFGEDFYLEIQNHGLDDERKVAYGIKLISEKCGIPMVATNDVHYLNRKDADTQAILMCIQTNNVITDGKPIGFEVDEFYFKSYDEMKALFPGYSGAIENTVKIAEKCNFNFEFDKLHLPTFTPENGLSHAEKLREEAYLGYRRLAEAGRFSLEKFGEKTYTDRIEYELSVIDKMGFNAYFLIVSDFVSFAKRENIPVGPGRGSGAGSLVAFCIGITDVDPIAFDLLFERFLNPERISMPDFDIDFCYNRREEVLDYVKRKYGDDKVAQIVTFGTLAPRAAVRDVGRALGLPYNKVDVIAKLIPRELNVSIDSALKTKELKAAYESDRDVRKLIDISRQLEGMPRHASTHAAGVVMTEKPTWEYVPLSYSGTGVVTQFDMTTDARLGLVKFDFLGLRYLTVISDAERAVQKKVPGFSIASVPFDDEKTFRLLSDAKTEGVFQLESGGMKQVLTKLLPNTLEDIIACIALFRPGPMDSIDTFIARKHGKEKIVYSTLALKEILDVTYGCIVYQEQVMQICRLLAGYSYAKADLVRRAMSKKNTETMMAERDNFIKGCTEHGIDAKVAESIFEQMVSFAKYAFNKSHATAYAILSYRTAYLKAHYPAEYFSALLTSVLDSTQKIRDYISDAAKFGVGLLPPDINASDVDFACDGGNIRHGLLAIRNIGRQFAQALINEREGGRFLSFDDFIHRMSKHDLNRRTVEYLIKCGAFDSLGKKRSVLLSSYETIIAAEQDKQRNNLSGQMDFFSMGSGASEALLDEGFTYPDMPEFSLKELLMLERESTGIYFSGHILDDYSSHLDTLKTDSISKILQSLSDEGGVSDYKDRDTVTVAGIITAKKTKTIKNGDTMAFITLEDKTSEIEVIVFARQYGKLENDIFLDNAIAVRGTISEEEGEAPKILLSELELLHSNEEFKARSVAAEQQAPKRLFVKLPKIDERSVEHLNRMAIRNPGNCEIVIYDASTKKYNAMRGAMIAGTDYVCSKLKDFFGEENVILK